ncbi:unnamed protein product [Didymodactylos carnosus]|uniref:Cadherin domain-containing protein n=2 Tax=Didymodactylos carnosus TaxID=1234261 RepID=A0A814GFF8_9BILA|nr:unnamed protein product [Didymodactylos carnosus]CAF3767250.1 unnamed protein product [Didymodactylos carnosus]
MLLILYIFIFNFIIIQGAILRLPSITVKEQSSIGSSVSDISRIYSNRSQKLRYTFLSETSLHNSYFIIDSLTGKISIKRMIDREELCRTNTCNCERCILNLEIVASTDTVDILSLEVLIENINDHDPTFPVSTFTIRISENTDIGYMASFPSAIDLDYGQGQSSNYLEYKLVSIEMNDKDLNETFQIIDLHTENQLGLKLLKKLDREIRNLYRMKIIVYDSSDEYQQRTGILLLNVQVLDSNDNIPKFEHDQYHIKLRENTQIGTEILRVQAIDNDDGLNSLINYTIVVNNRSTTRQQLLPFSINISTGIIYVEKLLDYEIETNYRFSIRAQDNGPESVSVYCQIKIDILDINDVAPEIDFILPDNDEWKIDIKNNIFYINEELKLYTRLFHISVSDKDSVNDKVQLNLLSYTNLFQLIEQYTDLYSLQIIGRLDAEKQNEYKLIFEAKDQPYPANGPSMSTQKYLKIILLDINDNYPIIEKLQNPLSVIENNPIGIKLGQFQSYDLDLSINNSLLTYTLISSNDSQCCLLDSTNGILYANRTYDYEKQTIYYLTLRVNDNGEPSLHSLMDFQLYINNSNDNSPIFKQKNFTFQIFEDVPIHTYIGQLNATDLDSGIYGIVRYELLYTQLYNEPEYIEISTITGELRTKALLDYETYPVHKFHVIAKDSDGHSDKALVIIHVLDINDNAPQIDFPTSVNNLVYISSSMLNQNYSETILITRIIAIDHDYGQNGNLSYKIDDGNMFNYFRIHEINGTILAQSDNLPFGYHRLRIRVTDHGWPSLSTLTYLNIKVGEHINKKHFQLVKAEQRLLSENKTIKNNNNLTKEMLFVVIISSILTLIFSISMGILITLLCKRKRFHISKTMDLLSDDDKLLTVGTTTTNGTDTNNKTNTLVSKKIVSTHDRQ